MAKRRTTFPYVRGALFRTGLSVLLGFSGRGVWAEETLSALPSFAELEAAGARIGEIRVVVGDVFDTSDPKEDKWLFRAANALHIQTRPGVIKRALLFRSGEPFSVQKVEETERSLRGLRYVYDVRIQAMAYHDGVVDLEVATRDTWMRAGPPAPRSQRTRASTRSTRGASSIVSTAVRRAAPRPSGAGRPAWWRGGFNAIPWE